MRKFHVFVGERYFVVYGENAEEYHDHLVFTKLNEDDCIVECARFKTWDGFVEMLQEHVEAASGGDNCCDAKAT